MFQRVLIANRGEIAVRVIRTLREMGITSIAVYSRGDRTSPHVTAADESYLLDGSSLAETYLSAPAIIEAARSSGAEAIHPGYGFLSENAPFAEACAAAGVVFIGPRPDAIAAMGDKVIAKRRMEEAGVPVVPGWSASAGADVSEFVEQAARLGYPVLVKAAAGGGGKGMRVVANESAMPDAVDAARREAAAAFGDERVFLEKYLARPRHVEFQIFGDEHGNAVHLNERECSIQRRHQKIIEETPSPALTDELRAEMGAAAVRAARVIEYTGAGTVEFMVDGSGRFYFLEVNTRLQVEHPVTEMTLGVDLVRAQILVAAGQRLPDSFGEIESRGHAIECRIYAEDPRRGFLPSTGVIAVYDPPSGPGIRVDSGIRAGMEIGVDFDPMLAKVITLAEDRPSAIARMQSALERFVILGLTTNIEFLHAVLDDEAFRAGAVSTHFLEDRTINAPPEDSIPDEALIAAAVAATRLGRGHADANAVGEAVHPGPWRLAGGWRGSR